MPASRRDCSEESTLPSSALRVRNHTPIARPTTESATATATMSATVVRRDRIDAYSTRATKPTPRTVWTRRERPPTSVLRRT